MKEECRVGEFGRADLAQSISSIFWNHKHPHPYRKKSCAGGYTSLFVVGGTASQRFQRHHEEGLLVHIESSCVVAWEMLSVASGPDMQRPCIHFLSLLTLSLFTFRAFGHPLVCRLELLAVHYRQRSSLCDAVHFFATELYWSSFQMMYRATHIRNGYAPLWNDRRHVTCSYHLRMNAHPLCVGQLVLTRIAAGGMDVAENRPHTPDTTELKCVEKTNPFLPPTPSPPKKEGERETHSRLPRTWSRF